MKTQFIYLSLSALLYNNFAICSAMNFDDIDEANFQAALQLSLRDSDQEFAAELSSQLNFDDSTLTQQEMNEHLLLEEYYASARRLPAQNNQPSGNLKEQALEDEGEINDNHFLILTEIFQILDREYKDSLKNIELLHFPNALLPNLDNIFVYQESDEDLAEKAGLTIQALKELRGSTLNRLQEVKRLAKEDGFLEAKDQAEKMMEEFIKKTNCSRSFAEKAYEKFIG